MLKPSCFCVCVCALGVRSWQKLFGRTGSRFGGQNICDNNCPSPAPLRSCSTNSTVLSQISSQHWLPGVCVCVFTFTFKGWKAQQRPQMYTDRVSVKINKYQPLRVCEWVRALYKWRRHPFLHSLLHCWPLCNQAPLIQLSCFRSQQNESYRLIWNRITQAFRLSGLMISSTWGKQLGSSRICFGLAGALQ